MNLSAYLKQRGRNICKDNGCTKEEHQCESYAYITSDLLIIDICMSDYFMGSSKPCAVIPLPWNGTQEQLTEEVHSQIYEQEEQEQP